MVWKLLSGIAAALLAVSLYFAVANGKALKTEKILAERAEKDHATLLARKKQGEEAQKTKLAQVETLKKELDATKQKVAKASAEAQEKDAALQLAKNTLTQVTQQVDTIQKKIDELGDVQKLLAQVDSLKKEQQAKDGEVASATAQLAAKKEALAGIQSAITKFRDQEVRARKGIVDPDFSARVASVFGDWGFVILNKGNSGGVFANADLEVKRGKDVVAKLKVRNVEQLISVADVVPGSVAKGDRLRSGDLVVAGPVQPAAPATPAAPPAGGAAAPGAPAAPAPAAAMSGDPFGGAAPAAAPAAPAAGGAMSDPFGGAPAAAPAPAAGGAGTKESPSTADPFGGAPAKPAAGAAPAGAADPFAPAK